MAVSHPFRRSGFLCLMLSLLLLHRGIAIDLSQSQMASRLVDDFVLVLQDNAVVLRNLSSIIASWVMRHIVSPILRKGFSSSIIEEASDKRG